MEGGADSGFRHVEPTTYEPRLFHVKGYKRDVNVREVPLNRRRLNSGDVFILDLGLSIYQWNGSECSKDEKFKALQYIQTLKSERSGKPKSETLEEGAIAQSHIFYEKLPETDEEDDDGEDEEDGDFQPSVFRLSNESGSLEFSLVSEGEILRSCLDSSDVFIIDTGKELFVWIGSGANREEKQNGMTYAHNYLMKTKHPLIPVSCVREGQESKEFKAVVN